MRRLAFWIVPTVLLVSACGTTESTDSNIAATTLAATTTSTLAPTTTTAATTTTEVRTTPKIERAIRYTDASRQYLDVVVPFTTGPWPVAVLLPGAFQPGQNYEWLALDLAESGVLVFSVTAEMSEPFGTALGQIACAVRFAGARAAEFGGDVEPVTLIGHSAGAAMGMVVAMTGDKYVADDCLTTAGTVDVDALVGFEGPFDWATQGYERIDLTSLEQDDPEQWAAVNPYQHLGGNLDLVVRLIHGDDADIAWYEVPRQVSIDFNDALLAAGYDSDLVFVEPANHGAMMEQEGEVLDLVVELMLETS